MEWKGEVTDAPKEITQTYSPKYFNFKQNKDKGRPALHCIPSSLTFYTLLRPPNHIATDSGCTPLPLAQLVQQPPTVIPTSPFQTWPDIHTHSERDAGTTSL